MKNEKGANLLKKVILEKYGNVRLENIVADENEFYYEFKANEEISENGNITVKNDDEYEQWLTNIKNKIADTNISRNGQLRSDFSGIKLTR